MGRRYLHKRLTFFERKRLAALRYPNPEGRQLTESEVLELDGLERKMRRRTCVHVYVSQRCPICKETP
jgi:hypothetical protein